jgi:hypothetical protein
MSSGMRASRAPLVLSESAAQLAALRIVVPAMILVCPETRHAPEIAASPAALRFPPEGLGWFVAHVPITPAVATLAQAVCVFSALCAAVGLKARHALVAMTLSAFYLFSLSQLQGAVWHDMHLLWMAALLAASPCDEALAYDRRGQPPPPDSQRYGAPLLFARLLLACVYFFPGFHKLATSGLAWALSDNLQHQLWWKWAEHGVRDPLRVDLVPGLLQAGGLFVLAFELSFPVLVMVPRARPWLAAAGVVFHLLAGVLFRIPFVSLWALYVVLVDPRKLLPRRWRSAVASRPETEIVAMATICPSGPPRASRLVGVLLVALAAVQGARGQMRAYPFACYPTFQWRVGTEMPDLLIELEDAGGRRTVLPHARDTRGYRTQRQWGEVWSLAGIHGHPGDARLRAYLAQLRRQEPARSLVSGAARVRFYRAYLSVVPEEREAPPRRDELLLDLPLTPS